MVILTSMIYKFGQKKSRTPLCLAWLCVAHGAEENRLALHVVLAVDRVFQQIREHHE